MASLTAHLLEGGDHGRLGFHPSCPVCRRERLFGPLPSEPVVSRRAQALLAGGVLAFSTSAPAVAIAHEPDRRGEGVEVPEDPGAGELHDPSFDPGGETALPFETAPVPPSPPAVGDQDDGAGAPIEVEPQNDPDAGLVPPIEPDAPIADAPVAPEEVAPVPPAEAVVPGADPAPGQPTPEVVVPLPPTEQPSSGDPLPRRPDRPDDRERPQPSEPVSVESGAGTSQEPLVAPPVAVPEPDPVVLVQADVPEQERPQGSLQRGRSYTVQPGDSLWAIAERLLGRDATPAQIAREVSRLWSLNEGRIGTGNPDLLMVGTHLSLR
jgi:LysM domain